MPKRIPIATAMRIAEETGSRQVILLAWDGEITHVVTYGKTKADCEQAASGGNKLKRMLGWPESMCNAAPRRAARGRQRELTDADVRAWVERNNCVDDSCGLSEARIAIDDARSIHMIKSETD